MLFFSTIQILINSDIFIFSNFTVRPISVEILNEVQPFSEYRKYELNCESVGSRPPAELSWWLDKRQLLNHSQKVCCR